jgi:3-hydroxybutyryl-CoA dehydrogenase
MGFDRVGVVGAGVMGAGVAQNLAETGNQVILILMKASFKRPVARSVCSVASEIRLLLL